MQRFLPGAALRPKQHDNQWFQRGCGLKLLRELDKVTPEQWHSRPSRRQAKKKKNADAAQQCAGRQGTVAGMSPVEQLEQHISSVGSRCATFFSDVLAAVQKDLMFCSPVALSFRQEA